MPTAKQQEYDSYPADYEDLKARQEKGNASDKVLSTADQRKDEEDDGKGRSYQVEDNEVEEYYGVAPEYATYASETDKPHAAEDGPLQVLEEQRDEMEESFNTPAEPDEEDDGTDNEGGQPPLEEPAPTATTSSAKKTTSSSS